MGYGFKSDRNDRGDRSFKPRNFNSSSSLAPVKEGEELDVIIESVGEKGDGIAKVKGFVIFVPKTKQNDSVRIKMKKVLNKVGFAEVVGKAEVKSEKEEKSDKKMGKSKAKKGKKSEDAEEVSGLKADEPSAKEDSESEFENEAEAEEESEEF